MPKHHINLNQKYVPTGGNYVMRVILVDEFVIMIEKKVAQYNTFSSYDIIGLRNGDTLQDGNLVYPKERNFYKLSSPHLQRAFHVYDTNTGKYTPDFVKALKMYKEVGKLMRTME